jgi:hypothetical protein
MANESQAKEATNLQKSNENANRPFYALGCDSNDSNDESKDVYTTEFVYIYIHLKINLELAIERILVMPRGGVNMRTSKLEKFFVQVKFVRTSDPV